MPFPFTAPPNPKVQPKWATEEESAQFSHPVGDAILGGSNALMGLIGVGPDSKANQMGQLVGAAMPLGGGMFRRGGEEILHPAVQKLIEVLKVKLPKPNLTGVATGSKVTGLRRPPIGRVDLPRDLELGEGFHRIIRPPTEKEQAWSTWDRAQKQLKSDPRLREGFPSEDIKVMEESPAIKGLEELGDISSLKGEQKPKPALSGQWHLRKRSNKHNPEDVARMLEMSERGGRPKDIADFFGKSSSHVARTIQRRRVKK